MKKKKLKTQNIREEVIYILNINRHLVLDKDNSLVLTYVQLEDIENFPIYSRIDDKFRAVLLDMDKCEDCFPLKVKVYLDEYEDMSESILQDMVLILDKSYEEKKMKVNSTSISLLEKLVG